MIPFITWLIKWQIELIFGAFNLNPEIEEQRHSTVKPFLKWVGGKRQLVPEMVKFMPRSYGHYFEPFLGGGALFFSQLPKNATISDVNEELVNCYQVVKQDPTALIAELKSYIYDKEYYYHVRNLDRDPVAFSTLTNVARAARLIYLNRSGFNGMYRVNSKGQFNVPFGTYKNPNIVNEQVILKASEALQSAEIKHASFETIVASARKGDFIYFDPPYMPLSTTSNFTKYAKDDFSEQWQEKLALTCRSLHEKQIRFIVSNSYCGKIKELYDGFNFAEIKAKRSINSKADGRAAISELLIHNANC